MPWAIKMHKKKMPLKRASLLLLNGITHRVVIKKVLQRTSLLQTSS